MNLKRAWLNFFSFISIFILLWLCAANPRQVANAFGSWYLTYISGTSTGVFNVIQLPSGMTLSNLPGGGVMLVATNLTTGPAGNSGGFPNPMTNDLNAGYHNVTNADAVGTRTIQDQYGNQAIDVENHQFAQYDWDLGHDVTADSFGCTNLNGVLPLMTITVTSNLHTFGSITSEGDVTADGAGFYGSTITVGDVYATNLHGNGSSITSVAQLTDLNATNAAIRTGSQAVTNGLPDATTVAGKAAINQNISLFPNDAGYVTAGVTNGLEPISTANTLTNSLVGASVTNGLATTNQNVSLFPNDAGYVTKTVTNGLPDANTLAGKASTNLFSGSNTGLVANAGAPDPSKFLRQDGSWTAPAGATNGLAYLLDLNATNAAIRTGSQAVTNGLPDSTALASATANRVYNNQTNVNLNGTLQIGGLTGGGTLDLLWYDFSQFIYPSGYTTNGGFATLYVDLLRHDTVAGSYATILDSQNIGRFISTNDLAALPDLNATNAAIRTGSQAVTNGLPDSTALANATSLFTTNGLPAGCSILHANGVVQSFGFDIVGWNLAIGSYDTAYVIGGRYAVTNFNVGLIFQLTNVTLYGYADAISEVFTDWSFQANMPKSYGQNGNTNLMDCQGIGGYSCEKCAWYGPWNTTQIVAPSFTNQMALGGHACPISLVGMIHPWFTGACNNVRVQGFRGKIIGQAPPNVEPAAYYGVGVGDLGTNQLIRDCEITWIPQYTNSVNGLPGEVDPVATTYYASENLKWSNIAFEAVKFLGPNWTGEYGVLPTTAFHDCWSSPVPTNQWSDGLYTGYLTYLESAALYPPGTPAAATNYPASQLYAGGAKVLPPDWNVSSGGITNGGNATLNTLYVNTETVSNRLTALGGIVGSELTVNGTNFTITVTNQIYNIISSTSVTGNFLTPTLIPAGAQCSYVVCSNASSIATVTITNASGAQGEPMVRAVDGFRSRGFTVSQPGVITFFYPGSPTQAGGVWYTFTGFYALTNQNVSLFPNDAGYVTNLLVKGVCGTNDTPSTAYLSLLVTNVGTRLQLTNDAGIYFDPTNNTFYAK